MRPQLPLRLACASLALFAAACGGDKSPDPCPAVPPCITGSTWNPSSCACLQDDELSDAAGAKADRTTTHDAEHDETEASATDAGSKDESSD